MICSYSQIQVLLAEVNVNARSLQDFDDLGSEDSRKEMLRTLQKLTTALSKPEEQILHDSFDLPPLNMCVRLAMDLRLFHIIEERKIAISAQELASKSNSDVGFVVRIMRVLTAANYVAEIGEYRYGSTPITTALINPAIEACVKHRYDTGAPALNQAPNFFQSHGYRSPSVNTDTPFQTAFSTDLSFYDYMESRPDAAQNFQVYMRSFEVRSPQWVDWFPVQEEILKPFFERQKQHESSDVLLVDVGGGKGQHLSLFRGRFPGADECLILQDLPAMLQGANDLVAGIKTVAHDFFTPQKVAGAKAYFFHCIFTNWSDDDCLRILRNTVSAMKPGYSKVILNEVLLPGTDCPWQYAALDLVMMTSFSGQLRSEPHWRRLLAAAGLTSVKFWHPPSIGDGIIEAMVEEEHPGTDPRARDPTYHTTNAAYTLPNDSVEQKRLEDQAIALTELMHGKVVHAPLKSPAKIVDVGCGTGAQSYEFGKAFPSAQVYGVDLSPVLAPSNPSNVDFIEGDIRLLAGSDERFSTASIDYIFARLLILGMTEWQGYVDDIASLLKSGGWVEMQDYDLDWWLDGSLCSSSWSWLAAIRKQAVRKGWDYNCGSNIKTYMERAGLVDVQQIVYRVPMGAWLATEMPETRHIGEHAASEYGMMYHHGIVKILDGAGYEKEEIEAFQAEAKQCLKGEEGKELHFFVTIGRKP